VKNRDGSFTPMLIVSVLAIVLSGLLLKADTAPPTAADKAVSVTAAQGAMGPVAVSAVDSGIPHTALGNQPLRAGVNGSSSPSVGALPVTSRSPSMDFARVGGALVAVVVLIFILRGLGRLFFPAATGRGQSRVVEVLSRSPLAPKQQVMLLRVGRRLIVVGDSGSQMNTLCEISDPDEVAGLVGQLREEKTMAAAAFGSLFGRFNRRYEAPAEDREAGGAVSELRDEPREVEVASAQGELDGLRDRVRLLAEQFGT
jgi:flagellar biogenesis protein FliO